jgi:hypothetical protein
MGRAMEDDPGTVRLSHAAVLMAAAIVAVTGCGPASVTYDSRPSPWVESALRAITCPSATHCVAVGWSKPHPGDVTATLIEENVGTGWRVVASPTITTGLGSQLQSVACSTATNCVAVGNSLDETSSPKTLILENTGKGWTIVPSPNPIAFGHELGGLSGVVCPTPTRCISVGSYETDSGFFNTLVVESRGGRWTIVPSPNSETGDSRLSQVSCPAPTRCLAIGSVTVESNGPVWNLTDGLAGGPVSALACPGVNFCVGVGLESHGCCPPIFTPYIIEMVNGRWSVVVSGARIGSLEGVACPAKDHCVAVGGASAGPLIEERIGGAWRNVDVSNLPASIDLGAVVCSSSTQCTAVGQVDGKTAFIAQNTGSGWKPAP